MCPWLGASVMWEEVLAPTIKDEQNLEWLMGNFWTWMMSRRLSLTYDWRPVQVRKGWREPPVLASAFHLAHSAHSVPGNSS
jgi:hypothetical protein